MSRHIFVSYATPDRDIALKMVGYLEARGLSCWIAPRDVPGGSKYAEVILGALASTDAFLLLFSEASNASEHVQREVERALNLSKMIVPARVADSVPSGSMDYYLATLHWIDAFGDSLGTPFEEIAQALAGGVGRELLEPEDDEVVGATADMVLSPGVELPSAPATSSRTVALDHLEKERQELSEAKATLENARGEFEKQQLQLKEERAKLELDQSQLAAIKSDLEEKRAKHENLEREFKLKAQIEFQRFQEDKRSRRAEWERERSEIEARLKEREEAFQLQEEQSFRSLREEKARLEQLAPDLEKAAAARNSEVEAQEESLKKLQRDMESLQGEISLREQQAAAAEIATERSRFEKDREQLAKEVESIEQQFQDQAAAFQAANARKEEIAAKEKADLEARRAAIERDMLALERKSKAEREELERRIAAERQQVADDFERKLEEQRKLTGDLEERHATEMEALREDIAKQEGRLREKQETLASEQQRISEIERISSIDPEEFAAEIAAEEERIENRHRSIGRELEKLRRGRLRRTLSIVCGVIIAVVGASWAGYYVKGQLIDPRLLEGRQAWEKQAEERSEARLNEDWPKLLRWCVNTDKQFQANEALKGFYQPRQGEVREEALHSIQGILATLETVPLEDPDGVVADINHFSESIPSAELVLLDAKLQVAGLLQRNAPAAALEAYGDATQRFPEVTGSLSRELDETLAMLEAEATDLEAFADSADTLMWLERIRTGIGSAAEDSSETQVRIGRLFTRIDAISLAQEGKPTEALRVLADLAAVDASFGDITAGDVAALLSVVEKLPESELLKASGDLTKVADIWALPGPYMLLARCTDDDTSRFDYYREADRLGDIDGRAEAGLTYVMIGRRDNDPEAIRIGLEKLREAAEAGSSVAMLGMGDAALIGEVPDPAEAIEWAEKAAAAGQPEAAYLKGRALLFQAEKIVGDSPNDATAKFETAGKVLQEAAAFNPAAWYHAALAYYRLEDHEQVKHCLEEGHKAKDPGATFMLAYSYVTGGGAVVQNVTKGNALMIEAAQGGDLRAIEYCRKNNLSH